jgi:hypothetical protein
MMRLAIDALVVAMVLAIIGGFVLTQRSGNQQTERLETTRDAVKRFQDEITIRSALEESDGVHHPASVDPAWFEGNLPMNLLIGDNAPWVEIAGSSEATLVHPQNRIALGNRTARFWYNPVLGIVRARVPANISDAEALEWYNYVNGSALDSLFAEATVD